MRLSKIVIACLAVSSICFSFSAQAEGEKTLCEKYSSALPKVVDDFVAKAAPDPKVNFFRDGKYSKMDVPKFKVHLINFMSDAIGCETKKYKGRSMKKTHKGMNVTKEEFSAIATNLEAVLTEDGVEPEDVKTIMGVVGSTAKDIIKK